MLDIDGVLTAGEAQPLDLDLLGSLATMNQAARRDGSRPAVTLCSGRPAPYVEVMLQAIDGHLPGVFENGAGLYIPSPYTFLPHPSHSGSDRIPAVRQALEAQLVRTGRAFLQPGKTYTLTLFPQNPEDIARLRGWSQAALGPLAEQVDLVYSTACLNVLPRGIDKGAGVAWLAERTGIPLQAMLGVGDSDVDLSFLRRVGQRAAPANANPAIRQIAHYVSPHPTGEGLRDILAHYGWTP